MIAIMYNRINQRKVIMAKQTSKKIAEKSAHECGCGNNCMCGCHKHGAMHIVKHIIVWAIIFALGMACGKMMNCGHYKKMQRKMQPVFTNGCLDMASIKNPKMAEKIVLADVNGDKCISIEEYKAWKKDRKANVQNGGEKMRREMRGLKNNA